MIKVLFDLNFDMIVYFITFFGLIQEKDNYSTRSGMTTAATIYNNNPVPVVHNAAVRIRTKVGSTSKYSANPPHTPNKKRSFLDLYNIDCGSGDVKIGDILFEDDLKKRNINALRWINIDCGRFWNGMV